jgi:hypothetical protein
VPTFGETGTGTNMSLVNYVGMWGSVFMSPADAGSLTKISVWINSVSGSPSGKALLFSVVSGVPASKLASSGSQLLVGNAWNDFDVAYELSPNTLYVLVLCVDVANAVYVRVQSQSGDQVNRKACTFCSEPSSWGSDNPINNYHDCVYATYVPFGGGQTYEVYVDAAVRSSSSQVPQSAFNVLRNAFAVAQASRLFESAFNVAGDARVQVFAGVFVEQVKEILMDAVVQSLAVERVECVFGVSKDAVVLVDVTGLVESTFSLGLDAAVRVLAEVSVVKEGEVKVTRLFLVFGDLAVQIQGD